MPCSREIHLAKTPNVLSVPKEEAPDSAWGSFRTHCKVQSRLRSDAPTEACGMHLKRSRRKMGEPPLAMERDGRGRTRRGDPSPGDDDVPEVKTVIIPLGTRIIVRLAQAVSPAGAAPAGAEPLADVAVRGVVMAAGAGRVDDHGQSVPLAIAAGDIILFRKHLGREVTFGDIQCWIIDADDIVKIEAGAKIPLLRSKVRVSPP
jgi:chaperonin GroES